MKGKEEHQPGSNTPVRHAIKYMAQDGGNVLLQYQEAYLTSDEHFSVAASESVGSVACSSICERAHILGMSFDCVMSGVKLGQESGLKHIIFVI